MNFINLKKELENQGGYNTARCEVLPTVVGYSLENQGGYNLKVRIY
jgi:hypothetical protein